MSIMNRVGEVIPSYFSWKYRVDGEWVTRTTEDLFGNKKVIVFSLPGAFTPTCSNQQLPGFEAMYDQFREAGINQIYCASVNDAFVMNAWLKELNITKVQPIPDGNLQLTHWTDMSVDKSNFGLGCRSWRYVMYINNMVVENVWAEIGCTDNCEGDPYEVTTPESIYEKVSPLLVTP
jgi:thioredoxin-dependent peroxiredoxin